MTSPTSRSDELHLGLFLSAGPHGVGGWRDERDAGGWYSGQYYRDMARRAEEALFDLVFVADTVAVPRTLGDSPDDMIRYGVGVPRLDPLTVLSNMAAATTYIGLVGTASTSFQHPYLLARSLASLDFLSDGRSGWNIVTSFQDAEARNFGAEALGSRTERYAQADEFVSLLAQLWDSWDDDALVLDRASGVLADPSKVHTVDYRSERYAVQGPLSLSRTPQGYPVLVQAGSSPQGRDFAARWSDLIFCSHASIEQAIDFYADVKARAERFGRDPDHIKILPSASPIVRSTTEDARDAALHIQNHVVPEAGLARLSYHLDIDLAQFDLDAPLPELDVPGVYGHYREVRHITDTRGLSLRELGVWYGGRTQGPLVGDPVSVADTMQEWFERRAADGFMISGHYLPGSLDEFAEHVVPLLRARGLTKTAYSGSTLRQNLGVPRPESGEWERRHA